MYIETLITKDTPRKIQDLLFNIIMCAYRNKLRRQRHQRKTWVCFNFKREYSRRYRLCPP